MDEVLERELKWDVDEHFAVPRLDDIVAGSDVERSTVTLNSAYYDTADGDLQTHGVLLRRREGDDDTGWQLKVPDAEGRVEIGYKVQPEYRRQGVATEVVHAMFDWAHDQGVDLFRASVSPDNVPSLAIVRGLGFRQVDVQIDDVDGEELVFHLDGWPPAA
jgi:GNAT superfamily N-acetyltransferase